jgi:hypothetical protein
MAVGHDVLIGKILLFLCVIFVLYYTFWTICLPLLEPNFFAHQYFPDSFYAIGVPLSVLSVMVTVLSVYALWLMKFQ